MAFSQKSSKTWRTTKQTKENTLTHTHIDYENKSPSPAVCADLGVRRTNITNFVCSVFLVLIVISFMLMHTHTHSFLCVYTHFDSSTSCRTLYKTSQTITWHSIYLYNKCCRNNNTTTSAQRINWHFLLFKVLAHLVAQRMFNTKLRVRIFAQREAFIVLFSYYLRKTSGKNANIH